MQACAGLAHEWLVVLALKLVAQLSLAHSAPVPVSHILTPPHTDATDRINSSSIRAAAHRSRASPFALHQQHLGVVAQGLTINPRAAL